MERPVIGVIPLVDQERDSLWMLPGYMEGVVQAGGLPVMLPLTGDPAVLRQIGEEMDGFLFTGGHDVSPDLYKEKQTERCGQCCRERDVMEALLFRQAWEKDKPVLGICRGIQMINVLLGGTLYQDLPSDHPSEVEHHQTPPYDVPVHEVEVLQDSPLYQMVKKERLEVNSYHHQAIKELASGLEPMAYSTDGLIEAVRAWDKSFVWAVQWHPEFSWKRDGDSRGIFMEFVTACLRQMEYRRHFQNE